MSVRMTVKQRLKGLAHGMIPVKNLITLSKIIKTTKEEIIFESDFELKKIVLNNSRKEKELCKTKYPILLVHGVFFRDTKLFNYWGRIPKELSANGATIYYGNHQSALSIKDSAEELTERIEEIINESVIMNSK
jgi:triacylglycerol lipase